MTRTMQTQATMCLVTSFKPHSTCRMRQLSLKVKMYNFDSGQWETHDQHHRKQKHSSVRAKEGRPLALLVWSSDDQRVASPQPLIILQEFICKPHMALYSLEGILRKLQKFTHLGKILSHTQFSNGLFLSVTRASRSLSTHRVLTVHHRNQTTQPSQNPLLIPIYIPYVNSFVNNNFS
jgi:hypothetical protein